MQAVWLLPAAMSVLSPASPMNTYEYVIANPLDSATPKAPPFRGEYFEMLGPETTTSYSEVYWQPQPMDLPQSIVDQFDGKVMAITGYEVDLVRTSGNTTIPAPCYELYNHHYSGWMYGKHASAAEQSGSDDNPVVGSGRAQPQAMAHGRPLPAWTVRASADVIPGIPNVQGLSEGNGNEHRGSYKGYAKGFAQLIQSPRTWRNNPMIINTNKRLTGDTSPGHINHKLVPPPRADGGILSPPDSVYSGLLECPCTTRKVKVLDGYMKRAESACASDARVRTPSECLSAARASGLPPAAANASRVHDAKNFPPGCSASPTADGWKLTLNTDEESTKACGPAPGAASPPTVGFGGAAQLGVNWSLSLDATAATATIQLSGPSDVWFALAFNATVMADLPYAIVVAANGSVSERRLAKHAPGRALPASLTVTAHEVRAGVRTLSLRRPLHGASPDHYSFNASEASLPMLAAHGTSGAKTLAYHSTNRAAVMLTLAPRGSDLCICRDPTSNSGTIDGLRFNPGVCAPYPESELRRHQPGQPEGNPICNISTYGGGLYCCHGGTMLLDADQTVPPSTDTWRLKYRFYFEDYSSGASSAAAAAAADVAPPSHRNLFRVWWSTEATNNEYDVPKSSADCLDPRTPEEQCTHTIVSKFTGRDMLVGPSACMVSGDPAACGNETRVAEEGGFYQLVYAAAHCHAPACKSLELWDSDKNELLCRAIAQYGQGVKKDYDEEGYLMAIPPCVWGSEAEGLRAPPRIHLTSNLTTIKHANSTNGHWGVMALWQARGAYIYAGS